MKQFLYFFGGLASGIFIGFVVTTNHYEELMEIERESMDNYYRKKREDEDRKNNAKKANKIISNQYFIRSSLEEGEKEVVDAELDIREDVYPMEERAQKPYIITGDEYHNGDFHSFDKDCVIYWAGNEMLTSEEEDEEFDISDVIGDDAIAWMVEHDTDRVYVRNERLGTDYEVVFNPNKFYKFNEEGVNDKKNE